MKLFITGGSGMVGKNVIAKISSSEMDYLAPSSRELNLTDYSALHNTLKSFQPDFIVHSAGLVGGIQANINSPYDFCYQNMLMGMNLIQAAKELGIKNIINLGSSCMYPKGAENPLVESDVLSGPLEPTNEGYAIAKVAVSRMARYASEQFDLSYKTLIPCNLYGYWDKFSPQNSHMIPAVIRKLHEAKISKQKVVDIWGDGKARREFMFAEDLADFIIFALENFELIPTEMNVGLGKDYSINEYYEYVSKEVGFVGEFEHDLSKPTGMKQKLVDTSNQKKLGWSPKTDLSEGIRKTYEFFLKEELN